MVINIQDYTERWLNDYIVYHYGHFANEYGDLDRADMYFNLKYQEAMEKLHEDALVGQMKAIQDTMKKLVPKAAQGLNFYDALQKGAVLEKTMDEIASAINEGIELAYNNGEVNTSNYEEVLNLATNYQGMLSDGLASVANVNAFFDLLLQGMTMAGKIDTSFLMGLTNIGQHLTGNSDFALNSQWGKKAVKSITVRDLTACKEVLQYLNDAVQKFEDASQTSKNTLSAADFSYTIRSIFDRQIGDRMSRTILANGIKKAMDQGDSMLMELVRSGKLTLGTGRFTLGRERQDIMNKNSSVDIFNSHAFQLSVAEGGDTYKIEIGLNTSVQWYNGLNKNTQIQMVASSPLENYFKSGTPEHYLAYNVIAHRDSPGGYSEVFKTLKAATAATFFNEWISGTGAAISHSVAYVNKVQYLMINGKIYSVMRIIRNICEEIAKSNNWNNAFNMDISVKNSNKWIGDSPNLELAIKRSELVNGVTNKLTIGATLNSNILLQYAY